MDDANFDWVFIRPQQDHITAEWAVDPDLSDSGMWWLSTDGPIAEDSGVIVYATAYAVIPVNDFDWTSCSVINEAEQPDISDLAPKTYLFRGIMEGKIVYDIPLGELHLWNPCDWIEIMNLPVTNIDKEE